MAVSVAKTTRSGKTSSSRFYAYLEGGPELAKALSDIDAKVKKQYGKDALMAGGKVIADDWAGRVPVLDGNYQQALQMPDTVKATGTSKGASGSVRPVFVPGVPDDEQPIAYAARLEFADGEPSARPAFDASRDRAADAVGQSLKDSLA